MQRCLRIATSLLLVLSAANAATSAAPLLQVEINAGYNFVVDSNVESPSTFAPTAATVAAEVCNYGSVPLTGVYAYIGDRDAGTPGIYPARDSATAAFIAEHSHLANTGSYALQHIGGSLGTSDATRYIGDLGVGECRYQYWMVTYPRRANPNNTGVAVWGLSNTPDDDLWLDWDVWATAAEGASAFDSQRATMRNEISAFANKIEPSGGLWFIEPTDVQPGQFLTSNGVNYDLGNINQGFDNDGDLVPDYNAWLQPIGDSGFDPACFRLVETSGQVIIRRSGGDPDLIIDFQDQLYFTDLPQNNTGGTGIVTYKFLVLSGPCGAALTPYQEVASGSDNEKFSGDFGTSLPRLQAGESDIELDKTVSASTIAAGGTLTYNLAFNNTGAVELGLPEFGMPLVVYDAIPVGTSYVAGSASYSLGFTPNTGARVLFSVDGGATFFGTEPVDPTSVTHIAVWLEDQLPAGGTGSVSFAVSVDSPFVGVPFLENTGELRFGTGTPFRQDETVTMVQGPNSLGDLVFHDQNRSGDFTVGEPGLPNVTVQLYYDRNGDGLRDAGDIFISSTSSSALGAYSFANLPAGDFLVVVDIDDPDLPTGYAATTDVLLAVSGLGTSTPSPYLAADFGFAPPIEVGKVLTSASPATEGSLVSYRIDLSNFIIAGGGEPCEFITWGQIETGSQWTNPPGIIGAGGPNGTFASATFNGNPHAIVNTWDLLSQSGAGVGNIVKVEVLASIYLNGALVNDVMNTRVSRGGVLVQADTFNATDLNVFGPTQGNAGLLIWDVTATGWLWTQFSGVGPEIDLGPNATGANDGVTMFGDAVGFRVTTDQMCGTGQAGQTVATLPLTDTYNPALLEFVSASVAPTSVAAGTLTWANVAALINAGTALTVTFRALEPPDIDADGEADTASLTNTACTSGGTYADGRPTNSDCGSATTTLVPRGEISGTVWNDSGLGGGINGNGNQDGAEVGIPGVTVELRVGGVLVATTTTDASGNYSFTGLADNTYTVIVLPASLPGTTFTQTGDPDATLNHQTTVTLNQNDGNPANDDATGLDFGYLVPNTVIGAVWRDVDGDGVQDTGEEGFVGTTVRLLDCGANALCGDGDDGATRTTTTGTGGSYVFSDLPNGNYQVVVDNTTLPAGITWQQTVDPDATVNHRSPVIAAAGGNLYGAYDFAYRPTGNSSIGDLLYRDWDGDGTIDTADDGIAGVTVFLYEDQDGDGVVDPEDALVATTVTSASGAYLFSGLAAGSYTVVVDRSDADLPGAWAQTDDPDASLDNRGAATVNGTNSVLTLDFGYQPLGGASIGDLVFNDIDADGFADASENGIAGITVNLYEDSNGNGILDAADALVATTLTDSSGNYLFQDLAAGSYLVDIDTADTNLPVDAYGNRFVLSTAGDPLAVTLTATQTYRDADFGFTRGATISDTLWRDDNGDAQQSETELGIPNVTVSLYRDVDGDGIYDPGLDTLVATDVTDTNGIYDFTGLPTGDYVVVVDSADADLPSTTVTGDPDTLLDGQAGISVVAGDIIKFADFGYQPPGVIGDRIWVDSDADGVFDLNLEAGISGVTVRLETPGGVVLATTTTDSEGLYSFGDLADGNYVVVVDTTTLPADLQLRFDPDEGNNCVVCNHRGSVTLTGGAQVLTIDFGYRPLPLPQILIDKDTSTPTVVAGGQATYSIRVQNAGTAAAVRVSVGDTLPAGFTFAATVAIEEDGATRTAVSAPTVGASALSWGTWTIDPLGSLLIRFTVNVASSVAAGTYDNTAAATYDADNNGIPETTINDDGTLPQDAGTPPTRDPEDDEDVTVASLPVLAIDKVSNGGGSVDPGDTVVYTVTLTNSGTAVASNVSVTDAVPTGATYVAASAQVSTPVNGAAQTVSDNFDPTAIYTANDGTVNFSAGWAEIGETTNATANDVQVVADLSGNAVRISAASNGLSRAANLSAYRFATLSFNYRRQAFDNVDDAVTVAISTNGTTFTTLATYDGATVATEATYQTASFDISAYLSATTTLRFLSGGLGNSDFFYVDNVLITAIPRATQVLAANVPANLVTAAQGYNLYPGETMTVSFSVQVNNPAPLGLTSLVNTAYATAEERPDPISDTVTDLINSPNTATIGDLVWDDDDGDGVKDPAEVGLKNVRLILYTAGSDNVFGTADDVQVASTFTDATGFYRFAGLAAGNYRVVVDPTSVPAAYDLTTGNEPLNVTLTSNSQVFSTADFGYRRVPVALPVTLAGFASEVGRGGLRLEWTTATETGNVGFHLWGLGASPGRDGESWKRLNTKLIASRAGDAVTPHVYQLDGVDPQITQVMLEDVDLRGRSRFHGPFGVGRRYGEPVVLDPVPWAALRAESEAAERHRQARRPAFAESSARLEVEKSGVHRVTHADLLAAGIDWTGLPVNEIALKNGGVAVPLRMLSRPLWNAESAVEFVAEASTSPYEAHNVYLLERDPAAALRVAVDRGRPSPLLAATRSAMSVAFTENERAYSFSAPNGDPWYDEWMLANGNSFAKSYRVAIDQVAATTGAQLAIDLWGVTNWPESPDHHLVVEVEGQVLADVLFDGLVSYPLVIDLPPAVLADGFVEFVLRLPRDLGLAFDLVALNSYGVRYARRLVAQSGRLEFAAAGKRIEVGGLASSDVSVYRSSGKRVELLEKVTIDRQGAGLVASFAGTDADANYVVADAAGRRKPVVELARPYLDPSTAFRRQVDVLAISHPDFIEGLAPWVAARERQGLVVEVVDLFDLYRFESGERVDPNAIRRFVRKVAEEFGIESLLLVGGDSYDYRNYLGLGAFSFLPSPYAPTGELVSFAPADPLYGDLDDDGVPDLAVGRLPVRSSQELERVIRKILEYDAVNPEAGVVFAADAYDVAAALDFKQGSRELAVLLGEDLSVEHAEIDTLGLAGAKQALRNALNAGPALAQYYGHSGPTLWSYQSLFTATDAAALTNTGHPTAVVQWGCWNTYYVAPSFNTLGHVLLLGENGAAVVMGAATLTEPESDLELAARLLPKLREPGQTFGRALLEAKQDLARKQDNRIDVIRGWTLLGDPTQKVPPLAPNPR